MTGTATMRRVASAGCVFQLADCEPRSFGETRSPLGSSQRLLLRPRSRRDVPAPKRSVSEDTAAVGLLPWVLPVLLCMVHLSLSSFYTTPWGRSGLFSHVGQLYNQHFPSSHLAGVLPAAKNFDLRRMKGRWTEVASSAAERQGCNRITFSEGGVIFLSADGQEKHAQLLTPYVDSPYYLTLQLKDGTQYPVWVVDTDYDNWAVLYSCVPTLGFECLHQAVVITREGQLISPLHMGHRLNTLAELGISGLSLPRPVPACTSTA